MVRSTWQAPDRGPSSGVDDAGSGALASDVVSPGQVVCRYVVERVLGRGGMATVYRVRHSTLGTVHALKVLDTSSHAVRQRLLLEGRVQARLRHPNLVSVTDVLDVGGSPGLLMEHVDGLRLDSWIRARAPDLQTSLRLFCGILSAMEQVHALGYVHRDLKSGNVLVLQDQGLWVPKVTDFGLAKVLHVQVGEHGTRAGVPMGTPAYMAPEQVREAQAVDQRADIFSLGCILYELVTQRNAFSGEDVLQTFNAVAEGRYQDPLELVPELPTSIAQGIHGALQPDRERRIPDCTSLREVLSGHLAWGGGEATPPGIAMPSCSFPQVQAFATIAPPDDDIELDLPETPTSATSGQSLFVSWFDADEPQEAADVEADTEDPTAVPEVGAQARPAPAGPQATGVAPRPRPVLVALLSSAITAAVLLGLWALAGRQPPGAAALPAAPGAAAQGPVEPPPARQPAQVVEAELPDAPGGEPSPAPSSEVAASEGQAAMGAPAPESPAPARQPVPSPAATPAPSPPSAAPPPRGATSAPAPSGLVEVTGEFEELWLRDSAGELHPPGELAPGSYDLVARFPSGTVLERADFLRVEGGQSYRVRCNALMENCR